VDVESLTVPEVDAAFDAIEETLQKYHLLLNGAGLVGAEPAPQFDTHEVFTFAWLVTEKSED
jgi:NAD(P)-dependent dehydrogenase (short-subunit alcohol dehydrogenase family)